MARYYYRNNWNRGGRYYGRNRYYKRSSAKSKSWGNMKAAKQQADQSTFTVNIPSEISCFARKVNSYTGDGNKLNGKSLGVYAMNIFDQLRKSEFFNNYASMYDEFKIDRIKVKLLPTQWTFNLNNGNYNYKNLTVYTAWDRSGLSNEQVEMVIGKDYTTGPIPGISQNTWVIGSQAGTANDDNGTDYGGIYVTIGSDITTYSSAESRTINPNTNTSIIRWLNPKTMQEKSQWISTGMLKPWYIHYDDKRGRYYYLPVSDIPGLYESSDVSATQQVVDIGSGQGYTAQKGILKQWKSGLTDDNPCSLLEDQGIRFKPTLLVGIYPNEETGTDAEPLNLIKFNVETEVVCSFRGLRKAKVVAA